MGSKLELIERKKKVKQSIKELIFNYKRTYDGCSPTIRWLMTELYEKTGRYLSTSMMSQYLIEIVKENEWSRDEGRKIVTKGEWNENSSKSS